MLSLCFSCSEEGRAIGSLSLRIKQGYGEMSPKPSVRLTETLYGLFLSSPPKHSRGQAASPALPWQSVCPGEAGRSCLACPRDLRHHRCLRGTCFQPGNPESSALRRGTERWGNAVPSWDRRPSVVVRHAGERGNELAERAAGREQAILHMAGAGAGGGSRPDALTPLLCGQGEKVLLCLPSAFSVKG